MFLELVLQEPGYLQNLRFMKLGPLKGCLILPAAAMSQIKRINLSSLIWSLGCRSFQGLSSNSNSTLLWCGHDLQTKCNKHLQLSDTESPVPHRPVFTTYLLQESAGGVLRSTRTGPTILFQVVSPCTCGKTCESLC